MIALTDRQSEKPPKTPRNSHRGIIQLPEISKSQELLVFQSPYYQRLNNRAQQALKKKQTKPNSPEMDTYYVKLPYINKKTEKTDNFFKLSKSQLQTQKILQNDKSHDNLKKYQNKIKEIQWRHNQYINKIEELYMITKQHS